jgi:hypothetical protein
MDNHEDGESDIYIYVCNVVCIGYVPKIVECPGSNDKTTVISNLAIECLCVSDASE